MDFRYLDAFLSVSKTLNFSKSGEELKISVSAVARQITLFEESLKKELFIRTNKGVSFTPEGEKIYQMVKSWQSDLEESKVEDRAPLSIGALQSVFVPTLLPFLKSSSKNFNVVVGSPDSLLEKLAKNEVSAVLSTRPLNLSSNMASYRLMQEKPLLFSHNPIGKHPFHDSTWIIFTPMERYWEKIKTTPKQVIRLNSLNATFDLIKSREGVTILPDSLQKFDKKLHLEKWRGEGEWIYFITMNYVKLPERLKELFDYLKRIN